MILEEIRLWQQKLRDGRQIGYDFHHRSQDQLPHQIKQVAFLGMGGSGIAGRILKLCMDKQADIPAIIVDGPEVPHYVNDATLAIVTSYSGNTWETKRGFEQLRERRVPMIVMAHGGALADEAAEHYIPYALMPESATPRSALGNFLGFLLAVFEKLRIIDGERIYDEMNDYCEQYLPRVDERDYYDEFVSLAVEYDMFHVWGVSGDSDAAAYRMQTQFNENSKVRAVFSSFPELCHNLLVGFTDLAIKPLVVTCSTAFLPSKLEINREITAELVQKQGGTLYKVPLLGDTWYQQLLHLIIWGDAASHYLGKQRGCEVEPVRLIDTLKDMQKDRNIT